MPKEPNVIILTKEKQRELKKQSWKELPFDKKRDYIFDRVSVTISLLSALAGSLFFGNWLSNVTDIDILFHLSYICFGGISMFYISTSISKRTADAFNSDLRYYEKHCDDLEAAIADAVDRHDFYPLRSVCDDKFFDDSMARYYSERYGDPPPM